MFLIGNSLSQWLSWRDPIHWRWRVLRKMVIMFYKSLISPEALVVEKYGKLNPPILPNPLQQTCWKFPFQWRVIFCCHCDGLLPGLRSISLVLHGDDNILLIMGIVPGRGMGPKTPNDPVAEGFLHGYGYDGLRWLWFLDKLNSYFALLEHLLEFLVYDQPPNAYLED